MFNINKWHREGEKERQKKILSYANCDIIAGAKNVRDYIITEQKIANVAICIHYENSKERNRKKDI